MRGYRETFRNAGLTAISGTATGIGLSVLFTALASGTAAGAAFAAVGVAGCMMLTAFNAACTVRAFVRERRPPDRDRAEPPDMPPRR